MLTNRRVVKEWADANIEFNITQQTMLKMNAMNSFYFTTGG